MGLMPFQQYFIDVMVPIVPGKTEKKNEVYLRNTYFMLSNVHLRNDYFMVSESHCEPHFMSISENFTSELINGHHM